MRDRAGTRYGPNLGTNHTRKPGQKGTRFPKVERKGAIIPSGGRRKVQSDITSDFEKYLNTNPYKPGDIPANKPSVEAKAEPKPDPSLLYSNDEIELKVVIYEDGTKAVWRWVKRVGERNDPNAWIQHLLCPPDLGTVHYWDVAKDFGFEYRDIPNIKVNDLEPELKPIMGTLRDRRILWHNGIYAGHLRASEGITDPTNPNEKA